MSELQSSLPLIDLAREATIVCEAVDPVTGAQVTGVTVANVAITFDPVAVAGDAVALPAVLGYKSGSA